MRRIKMADEISLNFAVFRVLYSRKIYRHTPCGAQRISIVDPYLVHLSHVTISITFTRPLWDSRERRINFKGGGSRTNRDRRFDSSTHPLLAHKSELIATLNWGYAHCLKWHGWYTSHISDITNGGDVNSNVTFRYGNVHLLDSLFCVRWINWRPGRSAQCSCISFNAFINNSY